MSELETIKHAAVKSVDGWVFIGKCHAECFHTAFNIKIKMSPRAVDQGFITSFGRYVKRAEAAEIAFKAKQIDKETNILFSEDLWSFEYSGKYIYDHEKGYEAR